jgi:endonuclease V-like protein UPF0215 family
MKKEIRVIGIDDAPFDKFHARKVLVVGVIYRGGQFMDGVVSTHASVDGRDATKKISEMLGKCKFRPQLRCILLKGIAVGGFNVIDIRKLHRATKLPVIVVMRHYPQLGKIEKTLTKLGMKGKIRLLRDAGEIHRMRGLYVQFCGTGKRDAEEMIRLTTSRAFIPEPLRIAHLVAGGVVAGESRGHA